MDISKRIFPGFYWNISKVNVNGVPREVEDIQVYCRSTMNGKTLHIL